MLIPEIKGHGSVNEEKYVCEQPISLFTIELFDWSKIHPEYFGSGDKLVKRM